MENSHSDDPVFTLEDPTKEVSSSTKVLRVALANETADNVWLERYLLDTYFALKEEQEFSVKLYVNTKTIHTTEDTLKTLAKENFLICDILQDQGLEEVKDTLANFLEQNKEEKVCIILNNLSDLYEKVSFETSRTLLNNLHKFKDGAIDNFTNFHFRTVENKKNLDILRILRTSQQTVLVGLSTDETLRVKQVPDISSYFDCFLVLRDNGLFVGIDRTHSLKIRNTVSTKIKFRLKNI